MSITVSNKKEEYTDKKEVLTSFFLDANYFPMTFKQISTFLNANKAKKAILTRLLDELELEGFIYLDESKRYCLCKKSGLFKATYEAKNSTYGFAILETGEKTYVQAVNNSFAMNKDEVLVRIISDDTSEGKSKEAKIEKILKHNTINLIGKLQTNKNFGFVVPVDERYYDIYIPKRSIKGYKNGDIVKVTITKYQTKVNKCEGEIVELIGNKNTDNLEVKILYKSFNLDKKENFNELILKELEAIPNEVTDADKADREDRTSYSYVTIDGDDAKDLDDAVYVQKLDSGYKLSVCIADVSHYVKEGSALDLEAVLRGTSIYIPGTVIPMLPKKLSNGICSLNAGVERLCLGIDIIYDNSGNVKDYHLFKGVINIKKRMTYDNVYKVLCEEAPEDYVPYVDEIFTMKELAMILKAKRIKAGSLEFDIPETKVILDEYGNVLDVKPYDITIANNIIEEFMLAANMVIAKNYECLGIPFMYRIHETPDIEKVSELNGILYNYGLKILNTKTVTPKTLANIINSIEDENTKQIISYYMLRTLKIAKYSNECLGHFGLAAKYYCHFTSPIRRYPDLFIHRVISTYLKQGYLTPEQEEKYKNQAIKYAMIASDMEKEATKIEREFDQLYHTIYMSRYVGEEFEASISSVNSFGTFVRLDNTVEGFVSFMNMPNSEYYIYDEKRHTLCGEITGQLFKVGDRVKVRLEECNIKQKQIDFSIL